jgi:hypothetical protein
MEYVKICGVNYQLVQKSQLEMPEDLGECHSDLQQIWLNVTNTPETNTNTILHECLHAISDAYQIDLSERQVCVLATALISFARDNPDHSKVIFGLPNQFDDENGFP